MTGECWNAFCIAGDCDGTNHVDTTGHAWQQARGERYCAACGGYVTPGECAHDSPVVTIYERDAEPRVWACEDCYWPWPLAGDPPEGAECDNCGGELIEGGRP